MKKLIAFCLLIVFSSAYAVELNQATDLQLMRQFLLPNATTQVETAALIGLREMLKGHYGVTDSSNAFDVSDALKKFLRKQIRANYIAKKAEQLKAGAADSARAETDRNLWLKEQD